MSLLHVAQRNYGVQATGRALLPLRCVDMEGGFLGKTLITLVYGRGGSTAEPPPLPTHRLAPHDIVALRPVATSGCKGEQQGGQGGANGGVGDATVQGVVYRVSDTQLIVAADEVDDGAALDVQLRLDKLANKVCPPQSLSCAHHALVILVPWHAECALFARG